jgi:hypothetical protein
MKCISIINPDGADAAFNFDPAKPAECFRFTDDKGIHSADHFVNPVRSPP